MNPKIIAYSEPLLKEITVGVDCPVPESSGVANNATDSCCPGPKRFTAFRRKGLSETAWNWDMRWSMESRWASNGLSTTARYWLLLDMASERNLVFPAEVQRRMPCSSRIYLHQRLSSRSLASIKACLSCSRLSTDRNWGNSSITFCGA